jgi:hypothetical protein
MTAVAIMTPRGYATFAFFTSPAMLPSESKPCRFHRIVDINADHCISCCVSCHTAGFQSIMNSCAMKGEMTMTAKTADVMVTHSRPRMLSATPTRTQKYLMTYNATVGTCGNRFSMYDVMRTM